MKRVLGGTIGFGEHEIHIEPEERQSPLARDRFDGKTLSTAGDTHDQEAPRHRNVCRSPGGGQHHLRPTVQPVLQNLEPADLTEPTVLRDMLENAVSPDELCFGLEESLFETIVFLVPPVKHSIQSMLDLGESKSR